MFRSAHCVVLVILAGVVGCASGRRPPPAAAPLPAVRSGLTLEADHGMVVSVCPIASEVGANVLREGGNAVDAAVATAFALAVTWPEAGNIGGGGFMMVAEPLGARALTGAAGGAAGSGVSSGGPRAPRDIAVHFVDYRETAPGDVKADTFAGKPGPHLLAGTPGTVRGLFTAHQNHGTRRFTWNQLVRPAATLARDGFAVDPALAASLNSGLRDAEAFAEFRRVYGKPDGSPWKAGDRIVLPDLAATLQAIADRGPTEFYEGQTARRMVDEVQSGGGLMSGDDLKKYRARLRQPLTGTFRGYTVYAPPPPSSGGVCSFRCCTCWSRRN